AKDAVVVLEDFRIPLVPQLVEKPRRALDVREDERDHAGRKLAHASSLLQRRDTVNDGFGQRWADRERLLRKRLERFGQLGELPLVRVGISTRVRVTFGRKPVRRWIALTARSASAGSTERGRVRYVRAPMARAARSVARTDSPSFTTRFASRLRSAS